MKVLITGICGFVGSTLARSWLEAEEGLVIHGIDNLIRPGSGRNVASLRKLGVTVLHGDIRSATDLEEAPDADWVVDAAALPSVLAGIDGSVSSRGLVEHNLLGTVNILEYCKRRTAGLILISTSRVYNIPQLAGLPVEPADDAFRPAPQRPLPRGLTEKGVCEDFSTEPPVSLYGSTKLASEVLAREYGGTFGFPVWIDRCSVLAGAGQFGKPDQGIFAWWINAWLRRRPLSYLGFGGKGFQVRDCLHPRDLVPLFRKQIAAGTSSPAPRLVNLGGGPAHAMSLAQLSRWCAGRFGAHTVSADPAGRPFDIPWFVTDTALAERTWGWRPQTSLDSILEEIALHAGQNPDWLAISGAL